MDASDTRTPLLIIAALITVYGILGWLDVQNYAQGGWNATPTNIVTEVLPGSPAEAGGLKVGDKIVSLGGIATTDAEALRARSRPGIGDTWEFVVERDGQRVSLDVTFGELVAERKFLAHAGFVVGFCFIGFTMWAFIRKQTDSTFTLGLAGVLFSLAFINGPYSHSPVLRSVDDAVANLLLWFGIASILNFLLVHLRLRRNRLIYVPGIAAGLFIVWRILAVPEATDTLNTISGIFIGLCAVFYLLASIYSIYRGFSAASAAERAARGLNLMLIGALVGLLPPLVGITSGIIAPQLVLPGSNFYMLFFAAVPITWSIAVDQA